MASRDVPLSRSASTAAKRYAVTNMSPFCAGTLLLMSLYGRAPQLAQTPHSLSTKCRLSTIPTHTHISSNILNVVRADYIPRVHFLARPYEWPPDVIGALPSLLSLPDSRFCTQPYLGWKLSILFLCYSLLFTLFLSVEDSKAHGNMPFHSALPTGFFPSLGYYNLIILTNYCSITSMPYWTEFSMSYKH